MTKSGGDAVERLSWGLRRYAWLVVLTVGTIVLLAGATTRPGPERYRATALVVAKKVELRPEQFPRFGEAVFATGAVAQETADNDGLDVKAEDLIPGHITMEPIQDTIAYRVIAVDRSPTSAVVLANAAASAFVSQLNKAGEGVGVFYVQDFARTPRRPLPPTRTLPTAIVIGLVAGAGLSLGLVGLLLIVRDPVGSADEAAAAVGAPLVGCLKLPRFSRWRVPTPDTVGGLAVAVRRLFPLREGTCVLLSCEGAETARSKVAILLAGIAARSSEVCLIASTERRVARFYRRAPARELSQGDPNEVSDDAVVIVDGPSLNQNYDVPEVFVTSGVQLLVVHEGVTRAALKEAAEQFLPGDLEGVLFVTRTRHRVRRRRPRTMPLWSPPAGRSRSSTTDSGRPSVTLRMTAKPLGVPQQGAIRRCNPA